MTVTAPAGFAGVVTVIAVLVVETIAAAVPPKVTDVVPVKPVPLMTTVVPPAVDPDATSS